MLARDGNERATLTIHAELGIDLNRLELVDRRKEKLRAVELALAAAHRTHSDVLRAAAIQQLEAEAEEDKEYSYFVRALLNANERR